MTHYLGGKPITPKSLRQDLKRYEQDLLRTPSLSARAMMLKDLIDNTQAQLEELTKGEK